MSLQSHSFNPLFYQKREKQLKDAGIFEVREIDFVYELWKVLRVKDVSPKYFVQNALGSFQISSEIRVDPACYRFGQDFIPDLLQNCSECRIKLYAIEKFVEYEGILDQQSLVAMLLRPFKVVLKKFQEESAVDAQKQLTKPQNLETINCYLIEFKQKVDKTHNFFKELLQFVAINSTEEIPLQLIKTIWKKFLLGLNSAIAPDDEFPLWPELYVELINLLGNYFNVVCDRRELNIEDRDSYCNVCDIQQSASIVSDAATHDKVNASQFFHQNNFSSESKPSYLFNLLMTPALEDDLLQSFRFAKRIELGGEVVARQQSFQDIFNNQEKQMMLKSQFRYLGNSFKSLMELLEKSAKSYKEQFMNYIFTGIKADGRLYIALSEIKELYSMRAFAATMSDFFDASNQPTNMADCLDQLKKDIVAVQNRFRSTANYMGYRDIEQNRWTIKMYDGEELWLIKLVGELGWPLSCVLDDELLQLLSKGFESCQRLFHSYNMIVNLIQKKKLGCVSVSLLARRKRMLAQNMFESVSVIYSVLRTSFEAIVCEKSALLLQCRSLAEMEQVIEGCKRRFKKLLDFEDLSSNSYIHAAVDGLFYLIKKFNASVDEDMFDKSSELAVESTLPTDSCSFNTQPINVRKTERKIEKWIKAQSRVITVLNTAAEPSGATDSNSVAYEIAVRSPKNPIKHH